MKIHFVGIGGEGMCGLAKLALSQGYEVTGSDIVMKPYLLELESLGAKIFHKHNAENIYGSQLVVRSSGISVNNIEIAAAYKLRIDVVKRSYCLGKLLKDTGQKIIRVAGSHGKSTTTAMLGLIFQKAGLDPTIIVGAHVPSFSSHAVIGKGPYAIVEACEFDRSFLDIPGFVSIITSIEPDHLDYYCGGLQEIVKTFIQFADQNDKDGIIITCADNKNINDLFLPNYIGNIKTYGLNFGDWQAKIMDKILYTNWNHFTAIKHNMIFGDFKLSFPGMHYIQNALGAIATADFLKINPEIIADGLAAFKGVSRRYEKIIDYENFKIIDDYGHTPIEIKSVIKAVREEFPEGFLLTIPCLRQFHRTKNLIEEFAKIFAMSDSCVVAPIVSGLGDDEKTIDSITSKDLALKIMFYGINTKSGSTNIEVADESIEILRKTRKNPKIILTIGSGISKDIIELLKKYSI